jgi:hypothetical protein
MSERVTLVGAETVQSAGCTIRNAAEDMNRAAQTINSSLQDFKQFIDDWLGRFEQILTDRCSGGDQ